MAQLSELAHGFLVEHERCAEHGEWVHAHEHEGGAPVEARFSSEVFEVAAPAPDGALGHEHDHCPTCFGRADTLLASPLFVVPPRAPPLCEVAYVNVASPSSWRAVYAFAPKTSPPV